MPVSTVSFQCISKTVYAYTLSSCNPQRPVSFMVGNQAYDPGRQRIDGFVGPTFPLQYVNVSSASEDPSEWDQNPIKLEICSPVSPTGKSQGNSAVFYGYFRYSHAGGLGFYLNQAQSRSYYSYGQAGIQASIIDGFPAIILF